MVQIEVQSSQKGVDSVFVDVTGISDKQFAEIQTVLADNLGKEKPSIAVARTFEWVLNQCPTANPSDVWQHIIYRSLLKLGWSDQRWKRVSGFALEQAIADIYLPRLMPYGVRIRFLTRSEITKQLEKLGILGQVKQSKLDLFLEGKKGNEWILFGAAHVKSSIAERIQDDVPASKILMGKGLLSIILTMDAKSFPPPHGDGINYGELGGRAWEKDKQRPKREYIEVDGQFDALFSFNLRSPPTTNAPPSGKRIITLSFNEKQPDELVQLIVSFWRKFSNLSN